MLILPPQLMHRSISATVDLPSSIFSMEKACYGTSSPEKDKVITIGGNATGHSWNWTDINTVDRAGVKRCKPFGCFTLHRKDQHKRTWKANSAWDMVNYEYIINTTRARQWEEMGFNIGHSCTIYCGVFCRTWCTEEDSECWHSTIALEHTHRMAAITAIESSHSFDWVVHK